VSAGVVYIHRRLHLVVAGKTLCGKRVYPSGVQVEERTIESLPRCANCKRSAERGRLPGGDE
jgi:hypothetical protein